MLEDLGVQILLGNTYHLYLRPGVEQVRRLGGLHRFMSWPRAILTDSGGFQVFSLSELRKVTEEGVTFRSHLDGSSHFFSPESAMEAQIGLGADIIMAFDECTEYPAEPEPGANVDGDDCCAGRRAARSISRTHKHEVPWNEDSGFEFQVSSDAPRNSKPEIRNCSTQSLFGIVQGGMDLELRRESAERTIEIGFPGYAIGGLSVGEPRALTREVVEATLAASSRRSAALPDGCGNSGGDRRIRRHGRRHDGLRAADAGRPARAAFYLGGKNLDQAGALRLR